MHNLIVAVVAWLVGSVSFAVIVSATMGLADPRSYGSGNPGATNVLRSGSKLAAALTLIGDAFKGWLAVWLVQRFGAHFGLGETAVAIAAVMVFIGHLYPAFFRLKGGKGVATAAGVMLALNPWLGAAVILVWLAVAVLLRYSSLAALSAAVCAPVFSVLLRYLWPARFPFPHRITVAICIISILLIWRHRSNISKLLSGTESRIGEKKKGAPE
jgi:glycerol-3-phosphate acyltransferase PlsY